MNTQDIGGSFLSEKEVKRINEITLRAPDDFLTYAQVFAFVAAENPNSEREGYHLAEEDEGTASIVRAGEDAPYIEISNEEVSYPIYKIKIQAQIDDESIQNSKVWGRPLNLEYVERAKVAVDTKTNEFLYVGDSKANRAGILSGSGFTLITGTDWSAANLDIANEVISYMNQLPVKYRKGDYSMVMNDTNFTQLDQYANTSSNFNDRTFRERILSAFPRLSLVNEIKFIAGTELYDGSTVATGIAMLIPKNSNIVRVKLAKAPYTKTAHKEVEEALKMAVASRIGIVETPFPTAIGLISGLQG